MGYKKVNSDVTKQRTESNVNVAYDKDGSQSIEYVFNKEEIKCLEKMNQTLHREGVVVINKNNPKRLS